MSKILDLDKPVYELAKEYPDFIDIFASLGFADIKNPVMLNSMGRIITVNKGSKMKKMFIRHCFTVLLRMRQVR